MGESLDAALPMSPRCAWPSINAARRLGLLHHSDRGVQYASAAYRALLADHHVIASMSRKGNCYDNAVMESFWSTLKNELIYRRIFSHPRRSSHSDLRLHRRLL
jgi:putative transposase